MKYTIEIPEELLATIQSLGYDLTSYFNEVFTKPLVTKHRIALEFEAVEKVRPEIEEKVTIIKDQVLLEQVVEPAPVDELPVEDPPVDPEEKN